MKTIITLVLLLCTSTSFAAGGAFQIYNGKLSYPDGSESITAPLDGKTIYNGSGAPSIAATPGDFYLDTSNTKLYGPYDGTWGSGVSLIGPIGGARCNLGDFINCYEGSPGTLNVGVCKSGTRVCNSDGVGFGSCVGQILPSRAICNGNDNDCDGVPDNNPICTAPAFTSTTPTSPSNNITPALNGTAPTGSTVSIYTSSSCTGNAITSGIASGGSFSVNVTVSANTTSIFYAKATDGFGDSSPCSTGISYSSDTNSTTPVISSSTPTSPSQAISITLNGTAEVGATVTIYRSNNCTGAPLASGLANSGNFAISTTVPPNSTNQFTAKAVDLAGNTSSCSSQFIYISDNTPPTVSIISTNPVSPSNVMTPLVIGTTNEGATVYIYSNAPCTGGYLSSGTSSQFSSTGIAVTVQTNSTTILYARAMDAAGNSSVCSQGISYTHTP